MNGRRVWTRVSVALTGAALITTATATASAQQLTPTRIVIAKPGSLTFPNPKVTINGTLETVPPSGQSPQPIPNEPVNLVLTWEHGQASKSVGTVTTDNSGNFTATVTVSQPGAILATFASAGSYGRGRGGVGLVVGQLMPARIMVDPIQPVPDGSVASVTGQVLMQLPDSSWVPAPYAPIATSGCSPRMNGWADSNGRFTAQVTANPDAHCAFYSQGDAGDSWATAAISAWVYVPLTTFPVRLQYFGPAVLINNRVPANNIVLSGFSYYEDSTGTLHGYPQAHVQLYFQPIGSSTWSLMATTIAGSDGIFQFPRISGYLPHGRLATGLWKAVVPASGPYLSSYAVNDGVVLAVPTWMRGVRVRSIRRHLYLTGSLDYLPHGGPLHGVTVILQATGSGGGLHRVSSERTNANGIFSFRLPRVTRGNPVGYDVYYPGGGLPAWAGPGAPAYAVCDPVNSPQFWFGR